MLAACGPQDVLALRQSSEAAEATSPLVSFRLVIQTSQCGSLIGKGGSKIKEIREVSFSVDAHGHFYRKYSPFPSTDHWSLCAGECVCMHV